MNLLLFGLQDYINVVLGILGMIRMNVLVNPKNLEAEQVGRCFFPEAASMPKVHEHRLPLLCVVLLEIAV